MSEEIEKYFVLLNKRIDLVFKEVVINSFEIKKLSSEGKTAPNGFKIFDGTVEWENKEIDGANTYIGFDQNTLNELLFNGKAVCPFLNTMHYQIH